jgi:hypothetical protein
MGQNYGKFMTCMFLLQWVYKSLTALSLGKIFFQAAKKSVGVHTQNNIVTFSGFTFLSKWGDSCSGHTNIQCV